jgi:hypothetical protein
VVAHVVLLTGVVASYGTWRPSMPRRSLAYLLDVAPAVREQPLPAPAAEPAPPARPRAPLALPTTPPLAAPTAPADPAPADTLGGRGGRGASIAGLRPGYGDARIWAPRPMFIPEGGGRPISLDSVVRNRLLVMADMLDSLARLDSLSPEADRRARNPRWVVERDGRRYGIDERGIHLGAFSLPTALLAFVPLPQGNVDQSRANQRLLEMRAEILRAAARAEAEDDFNRAVREIRERWRREREERREAERRRREQAEEEARPQP